MQIAKALLQGEENERKRLAGDLHDGLGGMLAGVKIHLSQLAMNNTVPNTAMDLNKVIEPLDNSVNELRRIARNMMPESLLQLLCKKIKALLPEICVLAFSDHTERSIIMQMLQNGASGYILKNAAAIEITTCIKNALRGEVVFSN